MVKNAQMSIDGEEILGKRVGKEYKGTNSMETSIGS